MISNEWYFIQNLKICRENYPKKYLKFKIEREFKHVRTHCSVLRTSGIYLRIVVVALFSQPIFKYFKHICFFVVISNMKTIPINVFKTNQIIYSMLITQQWNQNKLFYDFETQHDFKDRRTGRLDITKWLS